MAREQRMPSKRTFALGGSLKDFALLKGQDLTLRSKGFYAWQTARRENGFWPYARSLEGAPKAHCVITDPKRGVVPAVNFGSQDYLGLASSPVIKDAAIEALRNYGVHSAGSAALLGNSDISLALEGELSAFLNGRDIVLYPTGWAAGFGAIEGLIGPADHVVLDVLSHACLQAGARAATRKLQFYRHCDLVSLERKLSRIRSVDEKNAVLVVTESLFSMHAETPDLRGMLALCRQYGAALLVDCAHDMGCMGEDGRGQLSIQGVLDSVDIIVGSFSKTFASNGGFVALRSRSACEYLKYFSASHTFSNALSPVQAATILAALKIIQSETGANLRQILMRNIIELRQSMQRAGLDVLGIPSPIVPVEIGDEAMGRLVSRALAREHIVANLVEYPAVPIGQSRFRIQLMPEHSSDDIAQIVSAIQRAIRNCENEINIDGVNTDDPEVAA
jgi:glycine C-acetyltransferase